jgi:RecQ family ATP-dependent DNA helicase
VSALPGFLAHLLHPAGQTTLSFQVRRTLGRAFKGFTPSASELLDASEDPARAGLPDETAVEAWLSLCAEKPDASSPLDRWERMVARDGGALVAAVQTVLLDWFAHRPPEPARTLRIHIPNGMAGLVTTALFDFLEVAEHAAALLGEAWRAPRVSLTYIEADNQAAALGASLVNGFFGWEAGQTWTSPGQGARLQAAWQARRLDRGEAPPTGEVDLVLAAYLDGETFDVEEVERWRQALSAEGEVLVAARPAASRHRVDSDVPALPELPPFRPDERAASYFLDRYFGHGAFREGQWELVSRALTGQGVLGVLPTGAGKSICFQLPALLTPGTAIVVAPLVSLIHDQVQNLRRRGIELAGCVTGDMDDATRAEELERLYAGRCKLFYVSPERLQQAAFMGQLRAAVAAGRVRVSYIVVDEAHCASEWGHDFRPSYLYLPEASEQLAPEAPVLALTATASRDVRSDVLQMFRLPDEAYILPRHFDRPELAFEVLTVSNDATKLEALRHLLDTHLPVALGHRSHDELHRGTRRPYGAGGMIFTPYRRQKGEGKPATAALYAYEVCAWLQERGFDADFYFSPSDDHQDHDVLHNQAVQMAFTTDRLPLVVATKGFGTGLDKPNVRYVIHTSYASALEGYYQEAGRAGRDRGEARACLLYVPRHPDCRERIPECARPGVYKCPYGLEGKCSYGVQAFLTTGSFPGVDAEMAHHTRALRSLFGERLGRAGTCDLPLRTDTPDARLDFSAAREVVERTLRTLERFGLVADWNWAANQRVYYASPLMVDRARLLAACDRNEAATLASEDTPSLLEATFVSVLRLTRREARHVAQFYLNHLAPQIPKQKKARIDPTSLRRSQDRETKLEKLLYRLKRLGLVRHYAQVATGGRTMSWRVECEARSSEGVREGLAKALKSVLRDDPRGVGVALSRFDEAATTTMLDAVEAALEVWLEAYYSVYARRRFEMLANIEAYCATTECRKRRIMNYLNEHLTFGDDHRCGRCDNCGVEPLAEASATEHDPRPDGLSAALARVLAMDFLTTDLTEVVETFAAARMLTALRDRCQRHLEERPDDMNARTLAALAAAELGDADGADDGFDAAKRTALAHRSAEELERLLLWAPSRTRLEWLHEARTTELLSLERVSAWRHRTLSELGRQDEADGLLLRELRRLSAGWREVRVPPLPIEVPTP